MDPANCVSIASRCMPEIQVQAAPELVRGDLIGACRVSGLSFWEQMTIQMSGDGHVQVSGTVAHFLVSLKEL